MKLIVKGPVAQIVECTETEELKLHVMFTIRDTTHNPFSNRPRVYHMYRLRSKKLPVGLVNLLQMVWEGDLEIEDVDTLDPSGITTIGDWDLYDYQLYALKKIAQKRRGILEIGTGGGKTAILGACCKMMPTPIAVIIHRDVIFIQLVNELTRWGFDVGTVTSKEIDHKHNVVVCMVKTLHSRIGTEPGLWTWWMNEVQSILVDESHHAQAKTYQDLLKLSSAKYRIGCSATIPKKKSHNYWKTIQYLGPVIQRVSVGDLGDKGVVVPVTVKMHKYQHEKGVARGLWLASLRKFDVTEDQLFDLTKPTTAALKAKVTGHYYRLLQKELIVRNFSRNQIIAAEAVEGKGVLVVIDRIEHGETLAEMVPDAKFIQGASTDKQEALNALATGELRCLIATSIVDEGINISGINKVIIAGGGKSKRQLIQRVGRGVRLSEGKKELQVIDIMDQNQNLLENQAKERRRVYKKAGFTVTATGKQKKKVETQTKLTLGC